MTGKEIDTKKNSKNLPHDSLFKRIMEKDLAAREFLDEYLPADVRSILNLNSIKVEKESYIEPNLTRRLSDIVYSVKTKDNKDAFVYVLAESQSKVDPIMAFRLWKYTLLLAERHIEKKEKIPLIFPIVVYAGTARYTASRNLWDLFEYPDLAKKYLIENHALVDLQEMSDDEIAKKKHIALFEYILKHVKMRDMLKLWESLFKKLPDAVLMDKKHGYFYISNLLWYIDGKLTEDKRNELSSLIIEHLPKDDGEGLMRTIADGYIDQGIEKGIVIGKAERDAEIAKSLLSKNIDHDIISSATGLSIDRIMSMSKTD